MIFFRYKIGSVIYLFTVLYFFLLGINFFNVYCWNIFIQHWIIHLISYFIGIITSITQDTILIIHDKIVLNDTIQMNCIERIACYQITFNVYSTLFTYNSVFTCYIRLIGIILINVRRIHNYTVSVSWCYRWSGCFTVIYSNTIVCRFNRVLDVNSITHTFWDDVIDVDCCWNVSQYIVIIYIFFI